jgi:hypothetical protein
MVEKLKLRTLDDWKDYMLKGAGKKELENC